MHLYIYPHRYIKSSILSKHLSNYLNISGFSIILLFKKRFKAPKRGEKPRPGANKHCASKYKGTQAGRKAPSGCPETLRIKIQRHPGGAKSPVRVPINFAHQNTKAPRRGKKPRPGALKPCASKYKGTQAGQKAPPRCPEMVFDYPSKCICINFQEMRIFKSMGAGPFIVSLFKFSFGKSDVRRIFTGAASSCSPGFMRFCPLRQQNIDLWRGGGYILFIRQACSALQSCNVYKLRLVLHKR